jgi:diphosphomevalonate decarboxylase
MFAPTNIALIKYWGKRNIELQLPTHGSLSVTLPNWGTTTKIVLSENCHQFILNNKIITPADKQYLRLVDFLELIKPADNIFYKVISTSQVPIAAGLASSASGFAALVLALNNLHAWNLSLTELSIIARIGSGSACRSFWPGFVIWQDGIRDDGMDSYGVPLTEKWPGLCLGIIMHNVTAKEISSRHAMINCAQTSPLFQQWVQQASVDLANIQMSIMQKNFSKFGAIIENNASAMHACMAASVPAIIYSDAMTQNNLAAIKQLRKNGIEIYATQDAGANVKCVFMQNDAASIKKEFPHIQIIELF